VIFGLSVAEYFTEIEYLYLSIFYDSMIKSFLI
jgi:hypothetical protein